MNKKGFTLIELLAVIVILAIIALIATPIILNMISKARRSAAKDSALGYIDAINYNNDMSSMNLDYETGYTKIVDNTYDVDDIDIKLKGKKPVSGTVTILNGRVSSLEICIGGYNITSLNGKDVEVGDRCSDNISYTAYSVGDSINFNPVTNQKCTSPTSTTGTKQGCMKWYVIKASGTNDSTVDVILDHNTTAKVAWNSNVNSESAGEAETALSSDTSGWQGSPRLITANEIASITENTAFDGSDNSTWFCFGSNNNKEYSVQTDEQKAKQRSLAWLFDYTNGCTSHGCTIADSSTKGYWTSSPVSDSISSAWIVAYDGSLSKLNIANSGFGGIRPVITIKKSKLS